MIIDSKSGARGMVIDADTNRPIRWVRWADTDTGEYEAFRTEPNAALRMGILPADNTYRGRARLRFVPAAPRHDYGLSEKVDVPDDRTPGRRCERIVMLPGQLCEVRGCGKLAAWGVSDEQELEPARAGGRLWERAEMVRAHLLCHRHYRLPVFTSRRGVESEVEVAVRPQW